jgi:hypothetical protein
MKKPFGYQQSRGNPGIFARASLGDYAQLVSIFVATGGLIFLYSQVEIAQQTLDLSFHPTVEAFLSPSHRPSLAGVKSRLRFATQGQAMP